MAGDRHTRTFRTGLRPDEELYKRVLGKLHADGRNMNEEFESWLRWMDGQTDEQPRRPGEYREPHQ